MVKNGVNVVREVFSEEWELARSGSFRAKRSVCKVLTAAKRVDGYARDWAVFEVRLSMVDCEMVCVERCGAGICIRALTVSAIR